MEAVHDIQDEIKPDCQSSMFNNMMEKWLFRWFVTLNHLGSLTWKLCRKGPELSKHYLADDWLNHLSVIVYHGLTLFTPEAD